MESWDHDNYSDIPLSGMEFNVMQKVHGACGVKEYHENSGGWEKEDKKGGVSLNE